MKCRMAKADIRPMTAEQYLQFERAYLCSDLAGEAFLREDYRWACAWWLAAAEESTTESGRRACLENAVLSWSLIPVGKWTVQ